jgi:hypothetical protein
MDSNRPLFEELPLREGDPPWSAWGLYDPDDQLGTLNLLTPEVVVEAGREIRTGRRIGLDLPIDYLGKPSHGRQGLNHKVIWKSPRSVHDDEIAFNTQVRRHSLSLVQELTFELCRSQRNGTASAISATILNACGTTG